MLPQVNRIKKHRTGNRKRTNRPRVCESEPKKQTDRPPDKPIDPGPSTSQVRHHER